MKKRLLYAAFATCAFFAVSALAQGTGRVSGAPASFSVPKKLSDAKLILPKRHSRLIVEIKTGGDDFRAGSSITQQLIRPDGRAEPLKDLRYWEIWDSASGYSANARADGIPRNTTKEHYIELSGGMTLSEIRAHTLKLTFDGAPVNIGDSYDNWNIDQLYIYTPGVCEGPEGTELAVVGQVPAQRQVWRRMSGENRLVSIPINISGEAGAELTTKLEAEFWTGPDDLRRGAVAKAIVRLSDGTSYPPVNINAGEAWPSNSRYKVDINLPTPTVASSIQSIEITFDGAGRDFGESYDNWDIRRVLISSLEACKVGHVFLQKGTPWWRASAQERERTLYLARD